MPVFCQAVNILLEYSVRLCIYEHMNAQGCYTLVPITNLRRSGRRTVLWRATLHVGDAQHPVWVRNISAGGASVQGDIKAATGSAAVLDISVHGPFQCFIIWSADSLHGLAFADTLETVIGRFAENAVSLGMIEDA